MATLSRLNAPNLQNPVAEAEYAHLNRQINQQRRSRIRTLFFVTGLVMLIGIYTTNHLTSVGLFVVMPSMHDVYPLLVFTALVTFYHFLVMLHTLSMASETFVREKRQGTWESLILTSMDARSLVLGKWWGVVRTSWKEYLLLGVLRAIAAVLMGLTVMSHSAVSLFPLESTFTPEAYFDIVFAALAVVMLTMLNLLLTAAAGVAGSLISRLNSPSISTGQVVRLVALVIPIALFIPLIIIMINNSSLTTDMNYYGSVLIGGLQLLLVDNGGLTMAYMANPYDPQSLIYIVVVLLGITTYCGLTYTLLRLAQWLAYRQGAASDDG